ncbi:unnamed protein product [Prorocentrum cordatum]|uniref:Ran GTPase-activating protein (RanGAP) involved in mRNA processing and transport n=1 Tax=Prorocentrum cordatum TaxID=2364126 RepID=A0ABN9VN02_9DINO|nr:unnamed protein product [Polarella glacialis]
MASAAPWPVDSIEQRRDGTLAVKWAEADLTDTVLAQFVDSRLGVLLDMLSGSRDAADDAAVECTVDLSGNRLQGPAPLAGLLRRLSEAKVHTTVLRLHKNEFTDVAAAVLAEHIQRAAADGLPVMQLHLSGNAFTASGVETLIRAAHTCGGYPRSGPPG